MPLPATVDNMLNSALGRRIVSKIFTALNQYCRPIDICSCCARASGDFRRVPASASDIRNPGRIPRHRGMGVAWSRMNVRFGSVADVSGARRIGPLGAKSRHAYGAAEAYLCEGRVMRR